MTTELGQLERDIALGKFQTWINKLTMRGAADWSDYGIPDPTQKGQPTSVDRTDVVELFLSLHPEFQKLRELFAEGDKSLVVNSEAWTAESRQHRVAQLAPQAR